MSTTVFGQDSKVHPVTGRHIENGIGAPPEHVQVKRHIEDVEARHGKAAADEMRANADAYLAEQEDRRLETRAERIAREAEENADVKAAEAEAAEREAVAARAAADAENEAAAARKEGGEEI
jgi:hypothetical protein